MKITANRPQPLSADMVQPSKYHVTRDKILSEEEEINAAKRNPERFSVLYNRYHEQIFRFVYQRLDDRDQAFDTTSQIFLKAMTYLPRYENRGLPFASWLYRIAKSEVNQLFKDRKAQRTVNIETVYVKDMVEEMEESYREQYLEAVIEAIEELPEQDLMLVEMRFFEKRPFKEVAEILEITENNAKVRLYRLLDRIKKNIIVKK